MRKRLFLIFSLLTANFGVFAQYSKASEERRKELEEIVRQKERVYYEFINLKYIFV
ncbi:MAG: hypothetical protein LBE91_12600 [Tannerella sp.]|jgi:hypothetical protein|nr:hypothetical protein [Tannerella sp.]